MAPSESRNLIPTYPRADEHHRVSVFFFYSFGGHRKFDSSRHITRHIDGVLITNVIEPRDEELVRAFGYLNLRHPILVGESPVRMQKDVGALYGGLLTRRFRSAQRRDPDLLFRDMIDSLGHLRSGCS